MFTFSPIPSLTDLSQALLRLNSSASSASIAPWANDTNKAAWFSSGSHILGHIVEGWTKNNNNQKPIIWMPDYFCYSAMSFIRKHGCEIRFYPINMKLNPDWNACNLMLKDNPEPDIFVLVHYFGVASNTVKASEFCRKTNALFLEDGAHVLLAHGSIGKHCDAFFSCQHKVLPVPDGALLTGMFADTRKRPVSNNTSSSWAIKRAAQKLLPNSILKQRIRSLPGFFADLSEQKHWSVSASPLGQVMIDLYANRVDEITDSRKKAAKTWRKVFRPYKTTCLPFFSSADEGPAPYRFVLKCQTKNVADIVFKSFRTEGIAVEGWPDLPPEVKENPSRYPIACKLRKTLLFFPVFNSLDIDLMSLVNRCMRNVEQTHSK